MHNINVLDDLWPQRGEYLRYIGPDTVPYFPHDLKLTHGNEYEVSMIRYLPTADAVNIVDDYGFSHWVPLCKFSFIDQKEYYGQ